jgi:phosphoribosyl-ATP pyrophosphohydrolase
MSLDNLYATILDRKTNPKPGSYTCELLDKGEDEILKKVGEESVEVILASKSQGNARLIEEVADLTYHMLVLMAAKGISLQDVTEELKRRKR